MKIKTVRSKHFAVSNKQAGRLKKIMIICFVLGILLISGAYLSSHAVAWEMERTQKKHLSLNVNADQIQKRIKKDNAKNKNNTSSASAVKMVSIADLPNISTAMAKIKGDIIGSISIPSIKTYLPITSHASYESMLVSAAQLGPNQSGVETMGTGNYSLASHSLGDTGHDGLLFSSIKNLKAGDKIYITDRTSVWTYTVTKNSVISPKDMAALNNTSSPTLTLISCINIRARSDGSVYGLNRTDISAKLTSMSPWNDFPSSIRRTFVGFN